MGKNLMKVNMVESYCSHKRVVLSGNNIRNTRFMGEGGYIYGKNICH